MRKSEILETQKTPEEIRDIIIRNCEKRTFLKTDSNYFTNYFYRIEENLIYLTATKLTFWPQVQLELNEYIEPRLKVNYSGFILFVIIYSIFLIQFLSIVFDNLSWNNLTITFPILLVFISIPIYGSYVQKNTRNWLRWILSEVE